VSDRTVQGAGRDEVLDLVRTHLSQELGIDASAIEEETRFKEDLEADSLDLVELVMELEDRYGIRISEEEAERIKTVGQAVDFVLAHAPASPPS
jgi:acyl carrier protein